MRVLNIFSKDVHFVLELSLNDLKKVKMAMDNSQIHAEDEEGKEAMTFFSEQFYGFICDCIEEVEKDGS